MITYKPEHNNFYFRELYYEHMKDVPVEAFQKKRLRDLELKYEEAFSLFWALYQYLDIEEKLKFIDIGSAALQRLAAVKEKLPDELVEKLYKDWFNFEKKES